MLAAAQPPPDQQPSSPAAAQTQSVQERQWAMFAHLSALTGYVFPLGSILGPLLVWQLKKHEFEAVADQGKEALNFQLTMLLLMLPFIPLVFVSIGFVLIVGLAVLDLIFTIVDGMAANDGKRYRYPVNFRFITCPP